MVPFPSRRPKPERPDKPKKAKRFRSPAHLKFVREHACCACHTCHNPRCVNPAHLYVGTPLQNSQDAINANRNARGETQGSAKLKGADVVSIRADNRSYSKIAQTYGVSSSAIYRVKKRKNWRHLP